MTREEQSKRMEQIKHDIVKSGRHNGPAPIGFQKEHGILIPMEKELEIVRLIFESRKARMSIAAIVKMLNDKEYITKNGTAWTEYAVRTVLANRMVYQGYVRYKDKWYRGLQGNVL